MRHIPAVHRSDRWKRPKYTDYKGEVPERIRVNLLVYAVQIAGMDPGTRA
jgi:hypothetical protein